MRCIGFFFCKLKTAYEVLRSLVGSEMCIRDRLAVAPADACDTLEVVFETTNMPTETPTLYLSLIHI